MKYLNDVIFTIDEHEDRVWGSKMIRKTKNPGTCFRCAKLIVDDYPLIDEICIECICVGHVGGCV